MRFDRLDLRRWLTETIEPKNVSQTLPNTVGVVWARDYELTSLLKILCCFYSVFTTRMCYMISVGALLSIFKSL